MEAATSLLETNDIIVAQLLGSMRSTKTKVNNLNNYIEEGNEGDGDANDKNENDNNYKDINNNVYNQNNRNRNYGNSITNNDSIPLPMWRMHPLHRLVYICAYI
jgi:hypothetical protein